jgi:hypothetical protein
MRLCVVLYRHILTSFTDVSEGTSLQAINSVMSNRSASGKRLRASALDPATTNAPVKRRRGVVASDATDAERIASPDAWGEMSVIGSGQPAVLGSMAPQHLRSEGRVFVLMPFPLSALFFQKGPSSLLSPLAILQAPCHAALSLNVHLQYHVMVMEFIGAINSRTRQICQSFPMTVIFRLMLRDLQPNSRTRIELSVCFVTSVSQKPAEDREGCITFAVYQASSRRAISQSFGALACGQNYPSSSRLACRHGSRLVFGITVVPSTDNCLERAGILNSGTFR